MRISQLFCALAAPAFAALLADCSGGGSQLAPAGSPSDSAMQSVARLRTPGIDLRGDLGNRLPQLTEGRFIGTVAPSPSYLYASDYGSGNVDLFPEDGPFGTPSVCSGCGGFGLAVSTGSSPLLAMGTTTGTVKIFKLYGSGTPASPSYHNTLTLTGGDALGICFDGSGGVYADDYPGNKIDHWTSALAGTGHTVIPAYGDVNEVFYIACDSESASSTKLYAYGLNTNDSSNPANVDLVHQPGGLETTETLVGTLSSTTGYPGGVAINDQDDLIVNDQYTQTLYNMGTTEPWAGVATNGCTWGSTAPSLASVVWDDRNPAKPAEVWSGGLTPGDKAFAESFAAPIPSSGPCTTPGESGGPTTPQPNEVEYLGLAVYPNLGD
jgi:hypothetical protein